MLLETCARLGICRSSPTLQSGLLLSGHNLGHVEFSLGAPSSSWAGWILSQISCGKSLELELSNDEVVSVCRVLVAERCALFVEAGFGQWQDAFPTQEDMQPLGRSALIEPKGEITVALSGFFLPTCLCFHWPVQLVNLLLGWLPAPSSSALYRGSFPGKCGVGPAKGSPLYYSGLWKTGVG